jgi:transposase
VCASASSFDVALIDQYDALINDLELTIVREAKRHDGDAFHRLRSVPGIGKVLALTILYEIHDIARVDRVQACASDARLITCRKGSRGNEVATLATDASRRAALLIACIHAVCALFAPGRAGASTSKMATSFPREP